MPLTLNTSHPLYGNLKAFICVDDDNNIKDLVNTGVTFTKDAAVTIGTGTYGRHFRTLNNGFSPTLVTPVGAPSVAPTNQTYLLVFNDISGGGGANPASLYSGGHISAFQRTSGGTTGLSFGRWNSFWGRVDFTAETPNSLSNGAHSVCATRTGTTAHALFFDGASVSTGADIGNDNGGSYFGPFGGNNGVDSMGADFVYAMIFDKALSLAEYQSIASSLGANNAIGLLSAGGGGGTPVSFSGSVSNQSASVGVFFTMDVSGQFSGTLTPFSYALQAGSLGAVGLSRTGSVISGTPTGTAVLSGLQLRATDTGGNTADTNTFSITITSGPDTTPPVITGPAGATGSTSSVNVAENTTAVHTFTANETVTWSLNGGADVALFTINAGTGALSFLAAPDYETPTDANGDNAYIVGVRATDSASSPNSTTQTVTVTVTNVADSTGSFTTDAMENNTRSGVLASQAVSYTYVESGRVGSMSGKTVHDGTGTTAVDGTLTVAGLPVGSGVVHVAVLGATPADDQIFYQPVTVA